MEPEITEQSTTEPVRSLVTVQRIVNLEPIAGKDRIELASILGYKCVVKKGDFRIGQLCAFHEVDSFVPTAGPPEFVRTCYAFLNDKAKDCPNEAPPAPVVVDVAPAPDVPSPPAPVMPRRARIRTIKFRKLDGAAGEMLVEEKGLLGFVYSQGLALTLAECGLDPRVVREGDDITAQMNVTKFEAGAAGLPGVSGPRGKGLKSWPAFAPPKTDEMRLQSRPALLEEMRGRSAYVTCKIDGSSMTVIKRHDGSVHVCSRNFEVVPVEGEAPDVFTRAVAELGIADKIPPGFAVQGELAGPGIQKNRAGFDRLRFMVFNVFRYFDDESAPELCDFRTSRGFCQDQRLEFVPVLWSGWVIGPAVREPTEAIPNPEQHNLETFVKHALGQRYPNGNPAEGIVVRPETPCESRALRGQRLSFKVINPEYEVKS